MKAGASGANEGTQPSRESLQWRPVAGLECYAAPPAVGSGENEVCQSRCTRVSGEVDMGVEDIRSEFEAAKAVRNSAEVSQFPNFSQYEVNEFRAGMEASSAARRWPSLLNVRPPVGCENFALLTQQNSTVLEANEDSRN